MFLRDICGLTNTNGRKHWAGKMGNHCLVPNTASLMSVSRGSRKVDEPDLVLVCFTVDHSHFNEQWGTVKWFPSHILRWYPSAQSVKTVTVKARLETGGIHGTSRHPKFLRARIRRLKFGHGHIHPLLHVSWMSCWNGPKSRSQPGKDGNVVHGRSLRHLYAVDVCAGLPISCPYARP